MSAGVRHDDSVHHRTLIMVRQVEALDQALGRRIIELSHRVVADFDFGNWTEVGLLTGLSDTIESYPRLLRSLTFADEDYAGNVLGLLKRIAELDIVAFQLFERYVDEQFPGDAEFVSAKPADRRITFAPNVFSVPDASIEVDLAAVMMPFRAEFDPVKGVRSSFVRFCPL